MDNLPKIITAKYGLTNKLCNIFRDQIPLRDKMSLSLYYRKDGNIGVFFNKKTGQEYARYTWFADNKYKLSIIK